MKYRAPIDGVSELIDKFKNASRDLENARKNADLVDKKEKFYDSESELLKKAKAANDAIQAYVAVGLTDTSVEEIKNALMNAESEYRELHKKMVKDLYKIDEEGLNYYKYDTLSDGPEMKGFVMNYHNKLNNIELNEEMKERFINEVANSYVYNIAISNELDFIRFNR